MSSRKKTRDSGIGGNGDEEEETTRAKKLAGSRKELREKKKAVQKALRQAAAAASRVDPAFASTIELEEEIAILERSIAEQEEEEGEEVVILEEEDEEDENKMAEAAAAAATGTKPKTGTTPTTEEQTEERQAAIDAAAALNAAADIISGGRAAAGIPRAQAQGGGDRDFRQLVHASQLNLLGTFDGSTDVEIFVIQVNRCIDIYGWGDLATGQLVQTCMKGEAATWLRSLIKTATEDMKVRYWSNTQRGADGRHLPKSGLRYHMLMRFREEISGRGAIEAISDLKQRPTESVDEFRDRVVICMDKKNYRATEREKNTEAYRAQLKDDTYTWFAAGLNEEVRIAALGGVEPPEDLESLVIAARNAERERIRSKKPKFVVELAADGAVGGATSAAHQQHYYSSADLSADQATAESFQVAELKAEIEALRRTIGPVTCWLCDERGHISRDCPKRGRRGGRGATGYSSRGNSRGGGYRGGNSGGSYRPTNRGGGRRGKGRVFFRPTRTGDRSKRLFELVVDEGDQEPEEGNYEVEINQDDYNNLFEEETGDQNWPPNE
jgi:hypothetical protein